MNTNGEKPKGINKKKMRKMLYIYLCILLVLIFSSRTIYNISLPRVSAMLPRSGWLTKEIEARGVVEFAETFDIFATSNGWINDIFVRAGALVGEGEVIAQYSPATGVSEGTLAELGFAIERIENQLANLYVNRAAIQSHLQSVGTSPEDLRSHQWAIDDASATIERLQAELYEAQELAELINELGPVEADTIARRDWNRLVAELQDAQAELLSLWAEGDDFDDFNYQQKIIEASIILERRVAEFEAAEAALDNILKAPQARFDNFTYQRAVNTARIAHERTVVDYNAARFRYEQAMEIYIDAINWGADFEWLSSAQATLHKAENDLAQARIVRSEANNELDHVTAIMRRAQNDFDAQAAEARESTIANAENSLTQARHALEDATRVYENSVNMLGRARDSVIADAQVRVENALTALEDNSWNARQNISLVEARLADANNNLARAEDSLNLAQRTLTAQTNDARATLNLELQRINLDIDRVNIDLRAAQLSYYAASNNGAMAILSHHQGRVISVEKRPGQMVSRGDIIATIGISHGEFSLEFYASAAEAGFIELGDEASIYVGGSSMGIRATVYSIAPIHDNLSIRLIIETDQLNGGEYARVRIRKQTGPYNSIVPNSTVFAGAMGQHYVWMIRSRFGPLGTEYYVVRVNVLIADSDGFYTAISRGLEMVGAPVITSYSRDLSINGRVRRME